MATHNEVRIVGYLKKDPMIMNPGVEGEEKILCTVRVANRELDGYNDPPFQNILLYYDGTEMMDQIKTLKAYDLIDVKGVVNVLNMYKRSVCPSCGKENPPPITTAPCPTTRGANAGPSKATPP